MRPKKPRRVCCHPQATIFKPRGIPGRELELIELGLDELEALRLADVEGLHQEKAGMLMGVSRATFGRILESARHKVARAVVEGHGILIEDGGRGLAGPRH